MVHTYAIEETQSYSKEKEGAAKESVVRWLAMTTPSSEMHRPTIVYVATLTRTRRYVEDEYFFFGLVCTMRKRQRNPMCVWEWVFAVCRTRNGERNGNNSLVMWRWAKRYYYYYDYDYEWWLVTHTFYICWNVVWDATVRYDGEAMTISKVANQHSPNTRNFSHNNFLVSTSATIE